MYTKTHLTLAFFFFKGLQNLLFLKIMFAENDKAVDTVYTMQERPWAITVGFLGSEYFHWTTFMSSNSLVNSPKGTWGCKSKHGFENFFEDL